MIYFRTLGLQPADCHLYEYEGQLTSSMVVKAPHFFLLDLVCLELT